MGAVSEEGGGGKVAEEDFTRDMPNPMIVPKVEEVPSQTFSREGVCVCVCVNPVYTHVCIYVYVHSYSNYLEIDGVDSSDGCPE